jgi:DNA-directed RNA polymerase delta subunit
MNKTNTSPETSKQKSNNISMREAAKEWLEENPEADIYDEELIQALVKYTPTAGKDALDKLTELVTEEMDRICGIPSEAKVPPEE